MIIWQPQPGPQTALLECTAEDVFYGGARGGGKTDAMLGEWAQHASIYGKDAVGVFFRRELPQLDDAIARSKELYSQIGAEWQEQKKQWVFPNGAWLRFRPLERDQDAEKYQGQRATRVYVEELTQFPDPRPIDKLYAILRSAAGVPCFFRATGNPGGPGTTWVKRRYIEPAPRGWKIFPATNSEGKPIRGFERLYIPSKVTDNKILLKNDPDYTERLKLSGPPQLVQAWLDGNWDSIEGAAFEKLSRDKHMVRAFDIPEHWTRFMGIDWGSAKPFAVLWATVVDGGVLLAAKNGWPDTYLPNGAIVIYREFYGSNGRPNEGLRWESSVVAQKILEIEGEERIDYRIGDSAMWASDDGASVESKMFQASNGKIAMRQSQKDRRMNYQAIRERLFGDGDRPMLFIGENCANMWRTLPALSLDAREPEKGWDSNQEDHCFPHYTPILTKNGIKRIKDCDGVMVMARGGFFNAKLWQETLKEIYIIVFDNGEIIETTGNHPLLTSGGLFVRCDELHSGDKLSCVFSLSTKGANSLVERIIGFAANTINGVVLGCIGLYGSFTTEKSQTERITTCITGMAIGRIMILRILSLLAPLSIYLNTWQKDLLASNIDKETKSTLPKRILRLLIGISHKLAGHGTHNTLKRLIKSARRMILHAYIVAGFLSQGQKEKTFITARTDAPQPTGEKRILTIIKTAQKKRVINLTVNEVEEYVIGNGLIAHNCADVLGYMCREVPYRNTINSRASQAEAEYKRLLKKFKS